MRQPRLGQHERRQARQHAGVSHPRNRASPDGIRAPQQQLFGRVGCTRITSPFPPIIIAASEPPLLQGERSHRRTNRPLPSLAHITVAPAARMHVRTRQLRYSLSDELVHLVDVVEDHIFIGHACRRAGGDGRPPRSSSSSGNSGGRRRRSVDHGSRYSPFAAPVYATTLHP